MYSVQDTVAQPLGHICACESWWPLENLDQDGQKAVEEGRVHGGGAHDIDIVSELDGMVELMAEI
jgi:hypothetical protein